MSERGSFVTEFIYCTKCFQVVKGILLGKDKYFCSIAIPSPNDSTRGYPIIAGKIGGLYAGEEFITMEYEILPLLAEVICHPMRVAVLSDSNEERIFIVNPNGDVDVKDILRRDTR